MTISRRIAGPAFSRTNEEGQRTYTWSWPWPDFAPKPAQREVYSVTTLLNAGLPKWALMAHGAKMSSELAYRDVAAHDRRWGRTLCRQWAEQGHDWIAGIQADGGLTSINADKITDEEYALRWLKGAAPRYRDETRARGSAVHAEAEDLALVEIGELIEVGETQDGRLSIPPERVPTYEPWIAPRMAQFVRWVNDYRPMYFLTEASVYSHYGYAGTLDAGVRVHLQGRWWNVCLDYKTSEKAVYAETGIQTEAYRRADFVGLKDGSAYPMPKFDRCAVLRLTDSDYEFRWLNIVRGKDVSDAVFRLFLNTAEVARFSLPSPEYPKGLAAQIIGEKIEKEVP